MKLDCGVGALVAPVISAAGPPSGGPGWVLALVLATGCAPVATATELRFSRYGLKQGLSESSVNAIAQDPQGFLWIGTADGLNRFDGYTFKIYNNDPDDPGGLSDNMIVDLHVDSRGELWVATGRGLNRYDRAHDNFVQFHHDPNDENTLTGEGLGPIVEARDGRLWVTSEVGLNLFDPATGSVTRYPHDPADDRSLADDDINTALLDSENRLWIGTERGGVSRFIPETGTFTHYQHDRNDIRSLADDTVVSLAEDRHGDIWVGTNAGLDRLDPLTGTFDHYHHDPDDPTSLGSTLVRVLFTDSDGSLWAGTDGGGLNRYDEETDSWQRSKHQASNEHSLGSDVVISIAEDQDGNLWIGNYTGGLHFLDRHVSGFSHVGMRPDGLGLIHDSVLSFLEDTDGVLWVGTEGGLSRFDHLEGSAVHYRHDPHDPSSLSANAVLALERDSRGRLWVGTYFGGLNLLDERNGRFEHFQHAADDPDTLSGSNVWAVHEDSRGLLWVGTMNGLNRFDEENGVFVRYLPDLTNATALRHGITWRIHEDSQQRLWFCTQSGLSLYDRENDAFTHFVDLPHLSVATAFDDSQGRLWVGTRGGGLSRLDLQTGKIETFRTKDGLPSDVVVGILEDARGRLWLSTNSGISRFDPETRTFQSYDAGDGLRGSQFNRNAYLKTARGELLFGGLHGFNHFFPDQIQDNPHIPPVHLTEFKVFNTPARVGPDAPLAVPITQADQITLTYDQSVFSFGFAALGYRNPAKNRYAYRLVGFDRDWVQSGDRRTATYTNLDPGSYVFQVKASNDSGVWNDEGTSIRLTITPPFWRTRWFEALAALSLLTALVGLYRARTGYIRSRNRALQREIAQRRRAEEDREQLLTQMERSNTQLEVSNTELEARNTELERFAHAITHDLRSPLVTIRGFLGFLEMDTLAGDTNRVKQDIQRISTATERLRELFEELVELSKVGRLANPLPRVDIGELAREALALVQGEVRDSGVRVAIADDLPTVRADHVRLREVLQNLLENAVKFMGDQADPLIEIGATCTEGEVVCYVRDNGVGIDPRFHEQIFEMFDRLDADTPGTGIGLTLVKRIVEVHGGRIWVESEGEGRGAAFYFSLPQRNANGAPGDV